MAYPTNPTSGDTYTLGSKTWTYNGTNWVNQATFASGSSGGGGSVAFSDLTSTPTTLAGYGITDGATGTSESVPVGTVIYHSANTPPTNFIKANGDAVSRTTYSDLFTVIGTTYGVGDGSTTFNVPDLRGEFMRGWDDSRGIDTSRSFGSAQADELKAHTHTFSTHYNTGAGGVPLQGTSSPVGTVTTSSTGGSETRPRNIALLACIKYQATSGSGGGGSGGAGGLKSVQVFTSSGTWTRPSNITKVMVYVTGGGGGGGLYATGLDASTSIKLIDVSGISTATITVGTGGAGAAYGSTGSAGGASSWSDGTNTVTNTSGGDLNLSNGRFDAGSGQGAIKTTGGFWGGTYGQGGTRGSDPDEGANIPGGTGTDGIVYVVEHQTISGSSGGGGSVVYQASAPSSPSAGDLWINSTGNGTAGLSFYNGTEWHPAAGFSNYPAEPTWGSPTRTLTTGETWSIPAGVSNNAWIVVYMVGGGGGGCGDYYIGSTNFPYGSGGAGGAAHIFTIRASVLAGATFVIGAGGAVGGAMNGNTGGSTTLTTALGTPVTYTAVGGGGGSLSGGAITNANGVITWDTDPTATDFTTGWNVNGGTSGASGDAVAAEFGGGGGAGFAQTYIASQPSTSTYSGTGGVAINGTGGSGTSPGGGGGMGSHITGSGGGAGADGNVRLYY